MINSVLFKNKWFFFNPIYCLLYGDLSIFLQGLQNNINLISCILF